MGQPLNTPEERIAAAIWPPDNPDFRDVCNKIRLHVELEIERAQLQAFTSLVTQDAYQQGRALFLRDLILKKQKAVDQIKLRIDLIEGSQKNVKPIR